MIKNTEEFYQKLEIPYRVMLLSSGDMGKVSAKTYDIEAWMAGQNAYREIVSCSNCLDYQSRRLKIRFRDKTNEDTQYIHTLNSTLNCNRPELWLQYWKIIKQKMDMYKIPQVLQRIHGIISYNLEHTLIFWKLKVDNNWHVEKVDKGQVEEKNVG